MSITATPLATGTGTGSAVSVYTVPANTTAVVEVATFGNTTGGALGVTVLANDGADRQIDTKSIAGNDSWQSPGTQGLTLAAGQILKINAAVGIDYWVSGILIV